MRVILSLFIVILLNTGDFALAQNTRKFRQTLVASCYNYALFQSTNSIVIYKNTSRTNPKKFFYSGDFDLTEALDDELGGDPYPVFSAQNGVTLKRRVYRNAVGFVIPANSLGAEQSVSIKIFKNKGCRDQSGRLLSGCTSLDRDYPYTAYYNASLEEWNDSSDPSQGTFIFSSNKRLAHCRFK